MTATNSISEIRSRRARKAHSSVLYSSCAFTLVELLVSISILGVLISLLLPSVQAAREAARRTQCMNNLKQLSLGVQNYESARSILPPCGLVDDTRETYGKREYRVFDQMTGRMIGWAVLILPYVEASSLYDQFDFSKSILDQDSDPQANFVEPYLCPSDLSRERIYSDSEYTKGKIFAKANYATFVTPYHTDLQMLYPGALTSIPNKLSAVTDGTSQTIIFSEVRTLDFTEDERGVWALPWNGASILSFDMHHNIKAAGRFGKYLPWNVEYIANQVQSPNTLGPNHDMLVRCSDENLVQSELERMPCDTWKKCVGFDCYITYNSAAPRSLHPGGVNASYLDGHVEFLVNEVDPLVMAYSIDITGSEAR